MSEQAVTRMPPSSPNPAFSAARLRPGPVLLRLLTLLAVLLVLFAVLLGGKLFNGTAVRSMAFQLPELGILSLAMMT
jgi:hypothetical protein